MEKGHAEDREHDEAPPSYAEATRSPAGRPPLGQQSDYIDENQRLPQRLHSASGPSFLQIPHRGTLEFVVDFKKPMLEFWTLDVTPSQPLPELSYWQLKYSTKHTATMRRHAPEPQSWSPSKEVAEIKFPDTLRPGCGPLITFWPHEEEIERRGLRHVSATDRLMECTGRLTTKFALDLPALGGARVTWQVPREKEAEMEPDLSPMARSVTSPSEVSPRKAASWEVNNSQAKSPSWTPFSTQYLVEEFSNRAVATYIRAAPWSKHKGYLTIAHSEQGTSAEVIEGTVIATAAMVGMQDAIGLASSLIESGFDSVRGKGKGKAKDTG